MAVSSFREVTCKCCGGQTRPIGDVDSARSCEDRHGCPIFNPTGIAITYRRCDKCEFTFTDYFDNLSVSELGAQIYNEEYVLADPDFQGVRPAFFAREISRLLSPFAETIRALDFGGGSGLFSNTMKNQGFCFDTWDPYFADTTRPDAKYDLVTAYEVVEHSRDPIATFQEAVGTLKPNGLLLFSTQVFPAGAGLEWWYVAPRNGHVSLHTVASLRACAAACGFRALSLSAGDHLFLPARLSPLGRHIIRMRAGSALYFASHHGMRELARTAWWVARAGGLKAVLNPKHWARAFLSGIRTSS